MITARCKCGAIALQISPDVTGEQQKKVLEWIVQSVAVGTVLICACEDIDVQQTAPKIITDP